MIDLDNLPEDKFERLRLLGIDEGLWNDSEELIAMFEQGAIEEIARKQDV